MNLLQFLAVMYVPCIVIFLFLIFQAYRRPPVDEGLAKDALVSMLDGWYELPAYEEAT